MPSSATPPIEPPHLATFRSRGVAAPFTAPMLAGVRVRPGRHRGIELLLPNPSGEAGVYVLDWEGVRAMCGPTMHDTLLLRHVAQLAAIDPPGMRATALQVALDGHGGRDGMAAAQAALAADHAERVQANLSVLAILVGQAASATPRTEVLSGDDPALRRRASEALRRIAPALGRPVADLAAGLKQIGDALAPVGIGRDDFQARIPRLIRRLLGTEAALSGWLAADADNNASVLGPVVAATMRIAAGISSALVGVTRHLASDPVALLRRWVTQPTVTRDLITRSEWLLDGWERPCLLWEAAENGASRQAAVLEMAQLVPEPPREIRKWTDVPVPPEAFAQTCRVISQREEWRSGSAAFALIARNEKFLATNK